MPCVGQPKNKPKLNQCPTLVQRPFQITQSAAQPELLAPYHKGLTLGADFPKLDRNGSTWRDGLYGAPLTPILLRGTILMNRIGRHCCRDGNESIERRAVAFYAPDAEFHDNPQIRVGGFLRNVCVRHDTVLPYSILARSRFLFVCDGR
jgi:hypothetical protein